MSASTTSAVAPSSRHFSAVASAAVAFREKLTTTSHPAFDKRTAVAAPMPVPLPEMRAAGRSDWVFFATMRGYQKFELQSKIWNDVSSSVNRTSDPRHG